MFNIIAGADLWFENILLGVRTPFLLNVFNAITLLGNTGVVILVTGIVTIILFFNRCKSYAAGIIVAVAGAGITSYILKEIIKRARPDGLIPSSVETSFSFPSGHATAAIALYGFLAYTLCKLYPKYNAAIITLATLLVLVIGFSRLYLGLHFPSDVIGGYFFGGIWLLIGIKVATLLKRSAII